MRRRIYFIPLGIILLLVIGAVFFFPANEPTYEGRTLSEWMGDYHMPWGNGLGSLDDQMRRHDNASNAIVHIGPKAIPYLVNWLDYEQSGWSATFSKYLRGHKKKTRIGKILLDSLERRQTLSIQSPYTFRALGASAEEAIPQLAMLLNSSKPEVAKRAVSALSTLGPKGLSPLMAALADTSKTNRAFMALYISSSSMVTNARPAIPLLVKSLEDETPNVREAATNALMQIDPSVLQNASQ